MEKKTNMKSEKSCRYKIFHSGACAAGPGTCDRIGETRPGLSPRVAALTSGMVGKSEKALLAVSFGTTFAQTRERTIGAIERKLADRFPDREVRRSFTSRMIRKKLLERDGLRVDSPQEALERALEDGVRDMVVQPLYLMHGQEHLRLMETVEKYKSSFDRLAVGKPLLAGRRDCEVMAEAIGRHIPAAKGITGTSAVVMMGHGTDPEKAKRLPGQPDLFAGGDANAVYRILQETLREKGMDDHYIATVEGEPRIEDILPLVCRPEIRGVVLAPLMIVAGDHAVHDLAGEEEDSWKNLFARRGLQVETALQGIGEWEEVQELFAEHAIEASESVRHTDEQSI